MAASMGAFLLAGGTKGKRYALPNSEIMIHQPLGGAKGQVTDIEILTKVHGMEKWKVNLKFSGGKSGIRLQVTDWIEKIGQV